MTRATNDPAKEQVQASRKAAKRMNKAGARAVENLRAAARELRNASGRSTA